MEKYNKIRHTNKFSYLTTLFANLDALGKKHGETHLITDTRQKLQEFAGYEFMNAIRFRKEFEVIRDYCEKFFDCKEKGFSYQLGCRYQKIDFDFTPNIDAEIDYLKGLLKIYNPVFAQEINLIEKLIEDLEKFKPHFDEYLNS